MNLDAITKSEDFISYHIFHRRFFFCLSLFICSNMNNHIPKQFMLLIRFLLQHPVEVAIQWRDGHRHMLCTDKCIQTNAFHVITIIAIISSGSSIARAVAVCPLPMVANSASEYDPVALCSAFDISLKWKPNSNFIYYRVVVG